MVCDPNQNVNPINIRILTGFFCCCFSHHYGSVVKNPPANEEDTGLIPGLEDPLEEEMAIHSSILP